MNNIYSPQQIKSSMSDEEMKRLKRKAIIFYNNESRNGSQFYSAQFVIKRAYEIPFYNGHLKNETDLFKNLLAANIAFPDDLKFAEVVKSHGFDLSTLKCFNDTELDPKTKLKLLYKFVVGLKSFYGLDVRDLAFNKVNQLIAFHPEYLINREELVELSSVLSEVSTEYSNYGVITSYDINSTEPGIVNLRYSVLLDEKILDLMNVELTQLQKNIFDIISSKITNENIKIEVSIVVDANLLLTEQKKSEKRQSDYLRDKNLLEDINKLRRNHK